MPRRYSITIERRDGTTLQLALRAPNRLEARRVGRNLSKTRPAKRIRVAKR